MDKIRWVALLAFSTRFVSGSLIYDAPATMTGSRSVGNGLTSGGGNAYNDLLLNWSIVQKANGTFDYTYTIAGITAPLLSHAILELGSGCVTSPSANCVNNAQVGSSLSSMAPAALQLGDWCYGASVNPGVRCQGSSNLGLPRDIIGVEFNNLPGSTTVIITFNSGRAPVWGDVYLKGGQQYVFSSGIGRHATDTNALDFIARPGSLDPAETPEPHTLGLAGLGLALLVLRIRRRAK